MSDNIDAAMISRLEAEVERHFRTLEIARKDGATPAEMVIYHGRLADARDELAKGKKPGRLDAVEVL